MSDTQLQRQVLATCRALGARGFGGVIGGHVSARVPGEDRYWTNVLDRAFEEMTLDDIVLMDFSGNVIDGGRGVSPGIDFHQGIYQRRPDLNAVVHTHGFWITAQSAFNRPPKMWHNLCTYFYGRTAIAPDDSLESIAAAIGEEDVAIIIPWHGAITAGVDLAEATALHATFEYTARLDVTLAAAGAEPMPEESCLKMRALVESADYLNLTYDLLLRQSDFDMESVAMAAADAR
ncbi:MAG: class II aldolase/adducin family protein [Microthrixaceae bacterium]